MKTLMVICLAVVLLACAVDQLMAQTYTFQNGFNGYNYTIDTYIAGINPTTSYGTATSLIVDDNPPDGQHNALLKFGNIFGNETNQISEFQ